MKGVKKIKGKILIYEHATSSERSRNAKHFVARFESKEYT